jgi:hypothetical protein
MASILLTAASIGVMCASGVAVSAALSFLHNYEFDMRKKDKKSKVGGGRHDAKLDDLGKRVRPGSHI